MRLPDHPRVPDLIAQAVERLQREGHLAWLAGEGVANAWWADSGDRPASWLVLCSASAQQILALDPFAIHTAPLAEIVTLPTPAGPIDVRCGWASTRADDAETSDAAADLAGFGFSAYAVAYDPVAQEWIDPFGARADLEAKRLRCVGDAVEVLDREATAPLRALRLVSEAGLKPDAELENALGKVKLQFTLATRRHGRSELARMLLGPHAGAALELAERTGLAASLAPARPGASAWIDRLPRDLELRLAGWLRRDAANWLRDWRFGVDRSLRILDWLAHHPVEQCVDPRRDGAVGKLERRFAPTSLRALFTLREAELAAGVASAEEAARARAALEALERALARVRGNRERAAQRKTLALDGAAVMEVLGCGPGRQVGLALRHLTAWIAEEDARNEPEKLQVELKRWAQNSLD